MPDTFRRTAVKAVTFLLEDLELVHHHEGSPSSAPACPVPAVDLVRKLDRVLASSHEPHRAPALRYVLVDLRQAPEPQRSDEFSTLTPPAAQLAMGLLVVIAKAEGVHEAEQRVEDALDGVDTSGCDTLAERVQLVAQLAAERDLAHLHLEEVDMALKGEASTGWTPEDVAGRVEKLRAEVTKLRRRKFELLDDRMHLRQERDAAREAHATAVALGRIQERATTKAKLDEERTESGRLRGLLVERDAEIVALRRQRDLLHRVLQSYYSWGNSHCADRDIRLLAPWTAEAPPSEALGTLLWERSPIGLAWPEPMDEESLADGWCSECMTDLRPHGPNTRPTDNDTAREWLCPECGHTEPGAPSDEPETLEAT